MRPPRRGQTPSHAARRASRRRLSPAGGFFPAGGSLTRGAHPPLTSRRLICARCRLRAAAGLLLPLGSWEHVRRDANTWHSDAVVPRALISVAWLWLRAMRQCGQKHLPLGHVSNRRWKEKFMAQLLEAEGTGEATHHRPFACFLCFLLPLLARALCHYFLRFDLQRNTCTVL